jgi:lysophospholipase L1-like esterase
MSDTQPPDTKATPKAGKWRRLKFWSAVVLAMLVVEGGARLHQRIRMGDLTTYKPRHLVDFYRFYRVNPDYRSQTVRVNKAGFRNDEEMTTGKPENVVRVVMMGGSTVWGENGLSDFGAMSRIDNRDTMAAHLETILNRRAAERGSKLHVQVINAGVVGYLLFQEEIYFSTGVADYKPELVIAMDGHNDLDALQLGVPLYRHRNDGSFDREMNQPLAFDLYREAVRYSESKSMFVRKVSGKVSEWLNQMAVEAMKDKFTTPPAEPEIARWLAAYASTVRRFDASAHIAGTPILFTIQNEMASEHFKPLTAEERVMHDKTYEGYGWLHNTMRDRLIAEMRTLQEQRGIWFSDVTDAFKNDRGQAYIDYTHLSGHGAEVMAGRLASLVEAEVFCDAGASRSPRCAGARPAARGLTSSH